MFFKDGVVGDAVGDKTFFNFLEFLVVYHEVAVADIIRQLIEVTAFEDVNVTIVGKFVLWNVDSVSHVFVDKSATASKSVDVAHSVKFGEWLVGGFEILAVGIFGNVVGD